MDSATRQEHLLPLFVLSVAYAPPAARLSWKLVACLATAFAPLTGGQAEQLLKTHQKLYACERWDVVSGAYDYKLEGLIHD